MGDRSVGLIIVDGQNDFCEGGRLAIEGGSNDMKKIGKFIEDLGEELEHVIVTMDHHPFKHVGNANVWKNKGTGKNLNPGDKITPERYGDRRSGNGSVMFMHNGKEVFCTLPTAQDGAPWQPPSDARGEPTFTGPHTLWPVHCTVGSKGHALHPEITKALAKNDKPITWIEKGDNPDIEEYSAVTWRKMIKRRDEKTGEYLYNVYPNVLPADMESKAEMMVTSSPLLDKMYQLGVGVDMHDEEVDWDENDMPDIDENDMPENMVWYVVGLAANICVCQTYNDIVTSSILREMNAVRVKKFDLTAVEVFLVDDLMSEYIPENDERNPLQLMMRKAGETRVGALQALELTGEDTDDYVPDEQLWATTFADEMKKTLEMVDEFFDLGFGDDGRVPVIEQNKYQRVMLNGERASRMETGGEFITTDVFFRAVSNYPCDVNIESKVRSPVDPLSRDFYTKYLLPQRKSYMNRHFLLGDEPSVPPMTDMYTPKHNPVSGRGHFDLFGPNHLTVIVLQAPTDDEEGVFFVPVNKTIPEGSDEYRFLCSPNPPSEELPAKWHNNALETPTLTRLGTWYLPTPFPCKHAWCEATFFKVDDVTKVIRAPKLSQWEQNVLDMAYTTFVSGMME